MCTWLIFQSPLTSQCFARFHSSLLTLNPLHWFTRVPYIHSLFLVSVKFLFPQKTLFISSEQHWPHSKWVCGFNSSCINSLDSIALVGYKRLEPLLPWMNEDLRILKRQCRKAERRWKKDHLWISLLRLKGLTLTYKCSVLYYMINSVISPPSAQPVVSSSEKCEDFFLLPDKKAVP